MKHNLLSQEVIDENGPVITAALLIDAYKKYEEPGTLLVLLADYHNINITALYDMLEEAEIADTDFNG